ncbi:MAG: HEAT repeat domain-containing protein [Gammaproteobacteria bacterium]|nr:MAG: HEAT repeat domain-containing protein [Gammaproteobacteria bacterium]
MIIKSDDLFDCENNNICCSVEYCDLGVRDIIEYLLSSSKSFCDDDIKEKLKIIVSSPDLRVIVDRYLVNLSHNHSYLPKTLAGIGRLLLGERDGVSLSLILLERSEISKFLSTFPSRAAIAVVGPCGVKMLTYKVTGNKFNNDIFNREYKLYLHDKKIMNVGDIFIFNPGGKAIDLVPIGRATLLLILNYNIEEFLIWHFDRKNKFPVGVSAASFMDSRMQMAALALGKMSDGRDSDISALKKLLGHPRHFVRWQAMQSLGTLRPQDCLVALREALQDPHPHVRRAALKSLRRVQAQSAVQKTGGREG